MDFRLHEVGLAELKRIESELPGLIARKYEEARAAAQVKLAEVAGELGFTLEEIVGDRLVTTKKGKSVKAPVAVKYRHPSDPSLSWTGRGRKPIWMQAYLSGGGRVEELLV